MAMAMEGYIMLAYCMLVWKGVIVGSTSGLDKGKRERQLGKHEARLAAEVVGDHFGWYFQGGRE